MDRILISGLRELGVHGVLPEEQVRPQPFEVDVELLVDLAAAGASDDLDDTVDYGAVVRGGEPGRRRRSTTSLLERLAARIAEVCRADPRVVRRRRRGAQAAPAGARAMLDYVARPRRAVT